MDKKLSVWENCPGDTREKKETITVIVLSYNRPRMLRETLSSINGVEQVIIADDGSNFDLNSLKREFRHLNLSIITRPPTDGQTRAMIPMMGKMINLALEDVENELVTYICDDDIFASDWFIFVKDFFSKFPEHHIVRGIVKNIYDINKLDETEETILDDRGLTTGNFVHRIECFKNEGIRWNERVIVNADHAFLQNLHQVHSTLYVPIIEKMACYRRIHPMNLANFIGDNFSEEKIKEMLNKKWME